ncbi:preprotein translocase subunit SecA [Crossiella equi]|uniref:Protein translocase subunit SecA n=1 Tax=Crossiella equi TaxID=130796 RepID=A0ABS5AM88_9PSEU|nr:preprotein translocase subunit SecA [Crossiella equi]MBP2477688.1 preprotein translocase subunit SecA [Crossiella equi]
MSNEDVGLFGRLRRLGTALDRRLPPGLHELVRRVELEADLSDVDDRELARRVQGIAGPQHLPRLFALFSEACRRRIGHTPYREQILGAAVIAAGSLAEMATGEGKTLAVGMAAAWHGLSGCGVHVMTANDYLARRDADLLEPVYRLLGLRVAVLHPDLDAVARRAAYQADITYGTVSEFGFDHLRDNLITHLLDRVQRHPHAAILDEADALLIDEATTPLVITGPHTAAPTQWPRRLASVVPALVPVEHYRGTVSEQEATFTDEGWLALQHAVGSGEEIWRDPEALAAAQAALTAYLFLHHGRDYLVQDDQIVLLDPHTGRPLPGRRLGAGLHAALEAKHDLPVGGEPSTVAAISIQRLLRRYPLLGGLSGTVGTEAVELHRVYRLPVHTIPTRLPSRRTHAPDQLYATHTARELAVVEAVADAHRSGRPVLVGVPTVPDGDALSHRLDQLGIPHALLTARDTVGEAEVIATAGRLGAVTIATALAGRGTDIPLGGQPAQHAEQVRALGGLLVVGSGRAALRRVDDQLAGRTGRQGDPGEVRFLLSAQDDVLLDNAPAALRALQPVLAELGSTAVSGPQVRALVEQAQAVAETRRHTARQRMLRFDEILGHQHTAVAAQRQDLLATPLPVILGQLAAALARTLWTADEAALRADLHTLTPDGWPATTWTGRTGLAAVLHDRLLDVAAEHGTAAVRARILKVLDEAWAEQLELLFTLRTTVHSATWSRTDPVIAYREHAVRAYRRARTGLQRHLARDLLSTAPPGPNHGVEGVLPAPTQTDPGPPRPRRTP